MMKKETTTEISRSRIRKCASCCTTGAGSGPPEAAIFGSSRGFWIHCCEVCSACAYLFIFYVQAELIQLQPKLPGGQVICERFGFCIGVFWFAAGTYSAAVSIRPA